MKLKADLNNNSSSKYKYKAEQIKDKVLVGGKLSELGFKADTSGCSVKVCHSFKASKTTLI